MADVLLNRLHHDQPVHSQYGSVQQTTRRNRQPKDNDEFLHMWADAGINRDRVVGFDRDKVDDALDVTELSEFDVCEIEEWEYMRKTEVNVDIKESRLQGLKDRLAASYNQDAEVLGWQSTTAPPRP